MIKILKSKCTGCTICLKVCPVKVLEMQAGIAIVKNYHKCLECGACALNCEFDAIDVTKGTGCLVAIIKEDILKIAPKNSGCGCGESNCC
ncbi:MAG: 4Fe-4S binding protein [Candidatus Cloacimonetes bacterium]|nr:4Fe-4S binding protein [Candidatus Cloacimonadota bacterium]